MIGFADPSAAESARERLGAADGLPSRPADRLLQDLVAVQPGDNV